jgi:MoxR-like ATPase
MSEDQKAVFNRAPEIFKKLRREIDKVIVGQNVAIEQLLIAILAGGHALLESNPGLAKTLLVKTTASCLGLDYSRIQCTPDLMPADITGTTIIEEIDKAKSSVSRRDLFFPISSWRMRSTGHLPRPRALFWRPCKKSR